jgi:hypothetical protein
LAETANVIAEHGTSSSKRSANSRDTLSHFVRLAYLLGPRIVSTACIKAASGWSRQ